jgi:3-mercaptopyruvate sulfurtransferase SseA
MTVRKLTMLVSLVALLALAAPAANRQADSHGHAQDSVPRITVDELILKLAKKAPVLIIDVRNPDSYETKIKGAIQIQHDQIEAHLKQIPRNKEVVTYCA